MPRIYKTIEVLLEENSGVRGLILQSPGGPSFVYRIDRSKPPTLKGKYHKLGVIE